MAKKASPCGRCGGKKPPIRGARYCEACRDDAAAAAAASNEARKVERRFNRRRSDGERIRYVSKQMTPAGTKWCAHCQSFQTLDAFPKRNGDKPAPYCTPCQKAYHRQRSLSRKYGLEPGQYEALLEHQDGRCAICLSRPRKYKLAVDHDHKSGRIRGLLCNRCNHRLLGTARDTSEILHRAVAYLDNPPAQSTVWSPDVVPGHDPFDALIAGRLADLDREQANAGTPFGVLFVRRRGGQWLAVQSVEQWSAMWREATG